MLPVAVVAFGSDPANANDDSAATTVPAAIPS